MMVLLATAALLGGCHKEEKGTKEAAAPVIGVAECDDYIQKMEACFAKDSNIKGALEPGFQKARDTWKAAAARGDSTKGGLKQGCQTALTTIPPVCK
jgi:hypothetical protein